MLSKWCFLVWLNVFPEVAVRWALVVPIFIYICGFRWPNSQFIKLSDIGTFTSYNGNILFVLRLYQWGGFVKLYFSLYCNSWKSRFCAEVVTACACINIEIKQLNDSWSWQQAPWQQSCCRPTVSAHSVLFSSAELASECSLYNSCLLWQDSAVSAIGCAAWPRYTLIHSPLMTHIHSHLDYREKHTDGETVLKTQQKEEHLHGMYILLRKCSVVFSTEPETF